MDYERVIASVVECFKYMSEAAMSIYRYTLFVNYNQIALQKPASIYTPISNLSTDHLQHLALFSFSSFCQYNNHKIMYHFSSHFHFSYY